MRWAKPLDITLMLEVAASHEALVTLEEGCLMGGAGSAVAEAFQQAGVVKPILQLGLKDEFTEHGDPAVLLALQGLDAAGVEASVTARFGALLPARAAKVALKSVA
jgi:1-deoxy-D-xylulose-5-phosphate synthase